MPEGRDTIQVRFIEKANTDTARNEKYLSRKPKVFEFLGTRGRDFLKKTSIATPAVLKFRGNQLD
jgi:hypothetical protein